MEIVNDWSMIENFEIGWIMYELNSWYVIKYLNFIITKWRKKGYER